MFKWAGREGPLSLLAPLTPAGKKSTCTTPTAAYVTWATALHFSVFQTPRCKISIDNIIYLLGVVLSRYPVRASAYVVVNIIMAATNYLSLLN